MKFLDRISIVLFNFCLVAVSILIPVFSLASSNDFYYHQFEKNGLYSYIDGEGAERRTPIYFINGDFTLTAELSDQQLNIIADHIIEYLFTDLDSFQLVLNDVMLNEVETDGVSIFGELAISHMKDVKELLLIIKIIGIGTGILFFICIGYFIYRFKHLKNLLFKYSMYFYASIVILVGIFCGWCIINLIRINWKINFDNFTYMMWSNFHYLIFPFNPEKVENSSLSDALTEILTLDLFLDAIAIVLIILILVIVMWLMITLMIKKRYLMIEIYNNFKKYTIN